MRESFQKNDKEITGVEMLPEEPETESEREARRVVRELEGPVGAMLSQVLEQVKAGEYGLLIGDDASGRIPTRIVREVVNVFYRAAGRGEIPTRFIAGTRGYVPKMAGHVPERFKEKKEKLDESIQNLKVELPGLHSVLIVTDVIATGRSLGLLVDVLREHGLSSTVLSAGKSSSFSEQAVSQTLQAASVHYGSDEMPKIFNKWRLSGVEKDPKDLHARSVIHATCIFDPDDEHHAKERKQLAKEMRAARDEARMVAEEVLASLRGREESGME